MEQEWLRQRVAELEDMLPQRAARQTGRLDIATQCPDGLFAGLVHWPAELPRLVLIRHSEGYRADLFSPPDPHFLTQLYGDRQLDRALQDYTLDMLNEAAAKVQQDHPGAKPTSKASKQAVIDYIVRYST